jgi:hypothetical protein
VQLRPVAAYAGLMVVLCLALAWRHEVDWHLSGRCSELLRTEAAGDPALIARTRAAVKELLSGMSTWLLDLTVMKVGRTTFVVAYLNPAMPVDGPWLDRLRERIDQRCGELLGPVRTEVILTGQAPFAPCATHRPTGHQSQRLGDALRGSAKQSRPTPTSSRIKHANDRDLGVRHPIRSLCRSSPCAIICRQHM